MTNDLSSQKASAPPSKRSLSDMEEDGAPEESPTKRMAPSPKDIEDSSLAELHGDADDDGATGKAEVEVHTTDAGENEMQEVASTDLDSEKPVSNANEDDQEPEQSAGGRLDVAPVTTSLGTGATAEEPTSPLGDNFQHTIQAKHTDHMGDYYKVRNGPAETRDPYSMAIITMSSPTESSHPVVLWAKMDTGASFNFISDSLVTKLGLSRDNIDDSDSSNSSSIREFDGREIRIKESAKITFQAGFNFEKTFTDIVFDIFPAHVHEKACAHTEGDEEDNDGRYMPHILIGAPFLTESHALTLDPHFMGQPDPRIEVLEKPPGPGDEDLGFCFSNERGRSQSNHVPRGTRPPKQIWGGAPRR